MNVEEAMEIEEPAIGDNEIVANEIQAVEVEHELYEQDGDDIAGIGVIETHEIGEPGGINANVGYNEAPLSRRQQLNKQVRRKSFPPIKTSDEI